MHYINAYHETTYNYIQATQLHNVNTLIQNWSFNGLRIVETDLKPINNFKLILIPLRSFHICIERVDLNFEGIKISLINFSLQIYSYYFKIFACRRQMIKYMLSLATNHVTLTLWWQPWPMAIFCTRLHFLYILIN